MERKPTPCTTSHPPDWASFCLAVTEHAPLPMAMVEGVGHIVRCVNPAFCRVIHKPAEQLVGKPFSQMLPEKDDCQKLLDRVFRTGKPESHTEQGHSEARPVFWSYTMWPVDADERRVGVIIQVAATGQLQETMLAMNEALMVGSVRQHELTEAAASWNVQLQAEIRERTLAEEALRAARTALAQANAGLEQEVRDRTAKLQETVAELEHFSYTITHDMRAPLRAMHGFGGILLEECSECLHPTRREYIRRIVDSADRMDRLITDALQYSGVVRQHFELEPVDTDALLRGILESYLEFQPPHANIHIDTRLPVVIGNKTGLTQCFSNLLANAVKFVHPGQTPEVRVWAEVRSRASEERQGEPGPPDSTGNRFGPSPPMTGHPSPARDHARIWFEDKGIGIEKEYHDKIWQMFQQLNKSYEGTGIGLALVRKVVDRMEGKVGVESEPGQGSRFWVELKGADGSLAQGLLNRPPPGE
ncbi:MAG: ATP-binding protein [Verrucomicrobiota bacterium]|jgi:signal transduction histidine kinase